MPESVRLAKSRRLHALTRLESCLTGLVPNKWRKKTESSLLFTRLPPEIRRQILMYAFGDSTVHIGLKAQRVRRMFRRRRTEQWAWKGCFCHQKAVTWHNPPHFEGWRRAWCDDRCFEETCAPPKCVLPFDCRIGILGWLLTCRQAYHEGIDVLYGTNTIHLHGLVLLRELPDRFSRQRLDSLTKVELTWHLNPWLERDGPEEPIMKGPSSRNIPTMDAFISTAEALPTILPNIKHLYISLIGSLVPFSVSLNSPQTYHTTEQLLSVIDRSVRKLDKLVQCRIALPTSCFHMWKYQIPHIWDDAFRDSLDLGGVWRDLPPLTEAEADAETDADAGAAKETKSDGRDSDQGTTRGAKGYWVCHGKWDLPLPYLF